MAIKVLWILAVVQMDFCTTVILTCHCNFPLFVVINVSDCIRSAVLFLHVLMLFYD